MNKILFALGTLLLLLPIGLKAWSANQQNDVVATYQKKMSKVNEEEIKEKILSAQEYNECLFKTKLFDSKRYESELNLFQNSIMGSLEIPKISLKLPIYHGTKEEVLASGVGHLKDSSLPIGGENTHSVLTGHRGLPSAQLFTRLDELKIGDQFVIKVCNQVLWYQVSDICVVKPEETEGLAIRAGEDLVSLVTCTPYGINTHRLIITGERVECEAVHGKAAKTQSFDRRDVCFLMIPIVFLGASIARKKMRGGKI